MNTTLFFWIFLNSILVIFRWDIIRGLSKTELQFKEVCASLKKILGNKSKFKPSIEAKQAVIVQWKRIKLNKERTTKYKNDLISFNILVLAFLPPFLHFFSTLSAFYCLLYSRYSISSWQNLHLDGFLLIPFF